MMTASTNAAAVETAGRWKWRLAVVGGAVLAAVVVYLVETLAFDMDLKTPSMNNQESTTVNIGAVIFVSALASLLGWGLLALLEKFTAAARTIWTIVAAVVFLLSLGGPFTGADITTGNRVGLALLHLTVAVVLILFLPGAARRRSA